MSNILMLNYEFPPIGGGASPVSYDIGKGLAQLGHDITVVTMAYNDLPSSEIKDGMKIERVKCLRKEKMVCHPWEQLTYIFSAMQFITKNIDLSKIDVCYTHFIIPTGVIAYWLKKKYNIPYIITAHGSDVIGHNNKRFGFLYKLIKKPWCKIVKEAEKVVAPSIYLRELMHKNEPDGKYELIRNGVDCNIFKKGNNKKKKMLVMCRLQETKNVECVIEAIQNINLYEWDVDILGDGPCLDKLKSLVSGYRLENKIHFIGWVDNKSDKHLKYLKEASIYISASRVENCPTSILEAIACGDRILISDIPAHRQLIEEIDNTVFFDKDSPKQLSEKIQAVIFDCENTGKYSNTYDINKFNLAKTVERYNELIVNL